MQKGRKSPLKDSPLRTPGQSLNEKINDIMFLDASTYFTVAFFATFFAIIEWGRWYFKTPFSPAVFSIVAIITTAYCAYKIYKLKKTLKRMRLGRDGEIVVGHLLDSLRVDGYRVFHDLIGDSFNVDHVIICEHGVFTVETKTYSKPEQGKSEIIVQNERVIVDGYPSDKIAIQAKAEASWLQRIIHEATEKKIKVHPAVLFPGWYVDSTKATENIWFLNPDQLSALIRKQKKVLSHDEVVALTYCISQYIRTR